MAKNVPPNQPPDDNPERSYDQSSKRSAGRTADQSSDQTYDQSYDQSSDQSFVKRVLATLLRFRDARHRQVFLYQALKIAAQGALVITLIALLAVVIFILVRGVQHINGQLLFGDYGKYPSIKPAFVGTLYLVLISIAVAAPIGIGSAIFLSEYMNTTSRLVRVIRIATETLAGIPSIVYGIFGYLVFVVAFGFNYSLLGGGITLSIMILPVIVRSTEEALLAVPRSLREGSFALGASKVRTIFSVVLPCAANGIVTSLVLAIGRVISESAVLILTIGMVTDKMPGNITAPGTSLALDVYYFASHGFPNEAAATGVVLLVVVVSINLLATVLGRVYGKGELADG
ncbi:MAG: phosphate ABC transporter permease PstA [Peptococcaceae bacterium]|nr:phosphate ABC transporter permease PstA [Peptococcaceae bacterium]